MRLVASIEISLNTLANPEDERRRTKREARIGEVPIGPPTDRSRRFPRARDECGRTAWESSESVHPVIESHRAKRYPRRRIQIRRNRDSRPPPALESMRQAGRVPSPGKHRFCSLCLPQRRSASCTTASRSRLAIRSNCRSRSQPKLYKSKTRPNWAFGNGKTNSSAARISSRNVKSPPLANGIGSSAKRTPKSWLTVNSAIAA